jgi:hypothetical protein
MSDPPHLPVDKYTALVTSEHNQRKKFMDWLATLVQTYADQISTLLIMSSLFDLDYAVGEQLDKTGEWIGLSRYVRLPLEVYFTWDSDVPRGWDAGIWYTPYAPLYQSVRMDDDRYRLALKAKVGSNHWDGTIPSAYRIYETLFQGTDTKIGVLDMGHMHMALAVLGQIPDPINTHILLSGLLDLRPSAVKIDGYWFPTVPDTPYFGWDVESAAIQGWDEGAWGRLITGDELQPPPDMVTIQEEKNGQ